MGRAQRRRPGLAIGGRRDSRPAGRGRAAPNTHADSGGPAPQGQAAVPGAVSRPVPILIRSRPRGPSKTGGLISSGERPVRHGSRAGRVVRRFLLVGAAARRGSGGLGMVLRHQARTHGDSLALISFRPPAHRLGHGPVGPPRSVRKQGAAGVPSNRRAAGAAAEDTATGSWPSDSKVSSLWLAPWAPVRLRLAGRPMAQCLTKRLTSKTSFVWSMW
jgi:hypothetical protein